MVHSHQPYLYKWTQLSTGKWYVGSKSSVGCHPANHENYICSSKIVKPLVIEDRNDWSYEILVIGPAAYIRNLEKKYLQSLDARNNPMSYNQSNACCEYDKTGMKDSQETKLKKAWQGKAVRTQCLVKPEIYLLIMVNYIRKKES